MRTKTFVLIIFYLLPKILFSSIIEDYTSKISEHTLKNGLHLIILRDPSAPVISFHVHVKVGSVNEKPGETGISHLLEHLAFNGTSLIGTTDWKKEKKLLNKIDQAYERIREAERAEADKISMKKLEEDFYALKKKASSFSRSNEFAKILDMHGGMGTNAYCSYDMTAYWVELPSNKVELWAMLESDRLFNPVLRGFYEELDVVKEERRMRVDNSPWGKLMEEFSGTAYKLHPYRNPIIGYPEDLENMSRDKIRDFYLAHYAPSNIIISVAGDISPETFVPLAEKYFGGIRSGMPPNPDIPAEPAGRSEKRVIIRMDSQPILMEGFNIKDITHPDIPALDICSEILAGGRTSRLYRKLVKEERIAVSAGSWCWAPRYPGMLYLWAVASKDGDNRRLEKSIYGAIEEIKQGGVAEEELSAARARLKMELLTSLKSRMGMARELAWYKAVTGDWRNLFKYGENLEKVTVQDIRRVAKEYLVEENRTVGMVEPRTKD